MLTRILVAVFTIFCLTNGYLACSVSKTIYSVEIKSVGESLYKECLCDASGNDIVKPIWIGPNDLEIRLGELGIETEERYNLLKLMIKKLSIANNGTYKCQCQCGGTLYTSEQMELKVYNPLEIINTPEEQQVVLGDNSAIKCEGWGGLGERYLSWEKPAKKEYHKYIEVKDALIINNVTEEDKGIFICSLSDTVTGAKINRSINVQVVSKPRDVKIYPNPESTVLAGETLILECEADGSPEIVYTWTKEEPVTTSNQKEHTIGNNTSFENNKLIFENITAENHGTYRCTANNSIGSESSKIDIEVHVPPRIIVFNDTTAIEGTTVQIICNAIGRPEPNVSLFFIGKNLDEITDEIQLDSAFITVKPSVEGYYVCNATSDVGFETSSMYLTVLHKPVFEAESEIVWGWNGKSVDLSCVNDANPKAVVSWFISDFAIFTPEKLAQVQQLLQSLNSAPEHHLSLTVTDTDDLFGRYECLAKNDYGDAKKTIHFLHGFPPKQVTQVTTEIRSTAVTFYIQRPECDGPGIIGYMAEYDTSDNFNNTNIHPNRTWSIDREAEGFVLTDLTPNTDYYIKFAAINDVGYSEWNQAVKITTDTPSTPDAPNWQTDSVLVNATENLQLKWTPPVDNGVPIDFYLIRYCANCDIEGCKELHVTSATDFHTDALEQNTTYCVELRAHNSVGFSEASNITVIVGARTMKPLTLAAGAIIGIAIVIVILAFVTLDALLCAWKKQGMIASCYYKKSKKSKGESEQIRDKKGLLKENSAITDDTKNHKEFEYNKTTGVITGKHSSV